MYQVKGRELSNCLSHHIPPTSPLSAAARHVCFHLHKKRIRLTPSFMPWVLIT